MNRRGNNLISLVGGAALGAVAMYLLDPDAGKQRRSQLGDLAEGALNNAGGALNTGIGHLGEKASALSALAAEHVESLRDSNASESVQDAVASAGERLTHLGRDLLSRAKGWTSDAGSWGRGVVDDASDASANVSKRARSAASDARSSVQDWLGYESHQSHTGRNAALVVGVVTTGAAAAGALYFLDPVNGAQRRAAASEKIHQIVSDTGNAFRGLGNYVQQIVTRTRETASDVHDAIGMSSRDEGRAVEQSFTPNSEEANPAVPQM